jgi:hypothetical protein
MKADPPFAVPPTLVLAEITISSPPGKLVPAGRLMVFISGAVMFTLTLDVVFHPASMANCLMFGLATLETMFKTNSRTPNDE